jgi:hypothetical protein
MTTSITGQFDLFGAPAGAVPVVNPDGSVKGCTLIYAPAGQARVPQHHRGSR